MEALHCYDSDSDDDVEEKDPCATTQLGKRSPSLAQPNVKRLAVPMLPSFFSPVLTSKPDMVNDHQGRIRTQRAAINSWPTHVYIRVPLGDEVQGLLNEVLSSDSSIYSMEQTDHGFHLSLSKCLYLKEHQLDDFANAIQEQLQDSQRFSLSFAQLSILTNEEKTRSFLTAEVGAGYNELMGTLKKVDSVMRSFHQPEFYKPPRFHASLAWSLKTAPLDHAINTLPEKWMKDLAFVEYNISSVYVKMGNKLAVDLLHPTVEHEKRSHKLKRLVQSPNSYFMDVKCPGCLNISTVFSHAQTVVLCSSCGTVLCQPTGGRARLTEGCSFRKKAN